MSFIAPLRSSSTGTRGVVHDDGTELSSNPSVWEGHLPRKFKDLDWNFTAGPLRVADCTMRHWNRLHATNRSVLPKPDGTLVTIENRIPHISDDDLLRTVLISGVGCQPRRDRSFPATVTNRNVDTPLLRQRLAEQTLPPLPTRPKLVPGAPRLLAPAVGKTAGDVRSTASSSSVFSVTTVTASKAPHDKKVPTEGGSVGARSEVAGSKTSAVAASRVSIASTLKEQLRAEREARERAEKELEQAEHDLLRLENCSHHSVQAM